MYLIMTVLKIFNHLGNYKKNVLHLLKLIQCFLINELCMVFMYTIHTCIGVKKLNIKYDIKFPLY